MTRESGYQFGTFKGVFTPSLLTILGVIMYYSETIRDTSGLPPTLLVNAASLWISGDCFPHVSR